MSPVPKANRLEVLKAENLASLPWLLHGFSTRVGGFSKVYDGGLNLGFTKEDSREAVERNRVAFVQSLGDGSPQRRSHPPKVDHGGTPTPKIIGLRQIHSDLIHAVDTVPEHALVGDGLITSTSGLLLTVKTADCLPILLVDSKHRAIGAFHAGWRGTVKRIVEKGVGEMRQHFGTNTRDCLAAIGPGIRRCCYQVGEEVREQFVSQVAYAESLFEIHRAESDIVHERYPLLFLTARAPGHSELGQKILLDLAEANRRQLLDAGILAANITTLGSCTSCRTDLFFSYRREGPTGRMMAAVGVRD